MCCYFLYNTKNSYPVDAYLIPVRFWYGDSRFLSNGDIFISSFQVVRVGLKRKARPVPKATVPGIQLIWYLFRASIVIVVFCCCYFCCCYCFVVVLNYTTLICEIIILSMSTRLQINSHGQLSRYYRRSYARPARVRI
jgi:hypothetical protein